MKENNMAKPDLRKARMRLVKETQKIIYEDNPKFKEYFCTLPFYAHKGIIGELDYSAIEDQPWVEISTQNAGVGSVIEEDGTSRQKVIAFLINEL